MKEGLKGRADSQTISFEYPDPEEVVTESAVVVVVVVGSRQDSTHSFAQVGTVVVGWHRDLRKATVAGLSVEAAPHESFEKTPSSLST